MTLFSAEHGRMLADSEAEHDHEDNLNLYAVSLSLLNIILEVNLCSQFMVGSNKC